ncbi:MAG TPA: 4-(cytidine 5'-diphospho)-2-C-methyl-D-erythritol kinase [Thermoleophilia bacterium]|nr:4-(cytidine 5'-diphospho)-2-C-methyl-D-erythritol kinase [Thermoleophilia bacterium]
MSIGEHTADRVEIAAPAKLNLALLVGPVRPDGFHEIASLMLPVTLADHMTVEKTPGAGLDVACDVAPGADNLAAKLVRELEARLDRSFEVRITIDKRVPAGGGLGGGSSDAAAALHAVERLFDLDLSDRLRYDVALAVGSDVPFFLWPGPQLAMGRGQVLKEVELPALHLVIAMPGIGLSTAAVYKWRDEDAEVTLKDFAPRARLLSSRIRTARTARDVAALVANDLEPSVVARKEQVGGLIERLRGAGALAAAMTGSGAAVFGVFGSEAKARQAREAVAPARAWYVTDLQPGPEGGRTGRDEG